MSLKEKQYLCTEWSHLEPGAIDFIPDNYGPFENDYYHHILWVAAYKRACSPYLKFTLAKHLRKGTRGYHTDLRKGLDLCLDLHKIGMATHYKSLEPEILEFYVTDGSLITDTNFAKSLIQRQALKNPFYSKFLGIWYTQGRPEFGITPDESKALYYLNKGHRRGHILSTIELAFLYLDKDEINECIPYFSKASQEGDRQSQLILGYIYSGYFGQDDHIDLNKAEDYFRCRQDHHHGRIGLFSILPENSSEKLELHKTIMEEIHRGEDRCLSKIQEADFHMMCKNYDLARKSMREALLINPQIEDLSYFQSVRGELSKKGEEESSFEDFWGSTDSLKSEEDTEYESIIDLKIVDELKINDAPEDLYKEAGIIESPSEISTIQEEPSSIEPLSSQEVDTGRLQEAVQGPLIIQEIEGSPEIMHSVRKKKKAKLTKSEKKQIKIDKNQKDNEESQRKYREKLAKMRMTGELEVPKNLDFDQEVEYVFSSSEIEYQYYDILNRTFEEEDPEKAKLTALQSCIEIKPWGLQGDGQPEYLKYERSGWLSRRMLGKNRMVYKCLGTNPKGIYAGMGSGEETYKVLIDQLFGHYDD